MIFEILTVAVLAIAVCITVLLLTNETRLADMSVKNEIYGPFKRTKFPFESYHS